MSRFLQAAADNTVADIITAATWTGKSEVDKKTVAGDGNKPAFDVYQ